MQSEPAVKICGSCGADFGCGAKLDSCWCTELTLSESAAMDIAQKYRDCLCPKCLDKFASTVVDQDHLPGWGDGDRRRGGSRRYAEFLRRND